MGSGIGGNTKRTGKQTYNIVAVTESATMHGMESVFDNVVCILRYGNSIQNGVALTEQGKDALMNIFFDKSAVERVGDTAPPKAVHLGQFTIQGDGGVGESITGYHSDYIGNLRSRSCQENVNVFHWSVRHSSAL